MATIRHSFGIISIVVLYILASRIGSTDSYQHQSQTFKNCNGLILFQIRTRQDGPSLESSSYLNVALRNLGPWDLWTPGPWDSWNSSLLQHLILPLTSSYLLLSLHPTLLLWYGLVWFWYGLVWGWGGLECLRLWLEMDF